MFLALTVNMTDIKYNLQKMKTYLKRSQGTVMIWQIMILWKLNLLCNQCLLPLLLWVRIPLRQGVLDITLCDKICQWLATGRWFSPGTLVSSTNKTDCHDITEILLKVVVKQHSPNPCLLVCLFVLFDHSMQTLLNAHHSIILTLFIT